MPDIGTGNQRLEAAIAEHDNFAGTKSDVQDQYKLMDPKLFTGRNDLRAFKKTMKNQTKLMRSMFKQDANGDDSQRLNKKERDYLKEFKRENRNAYKMAKTVAREKGVLPSSSKIKGGLSNYLINPLMYAFKGANDSLLANKNFSSTARTANSLVDTAALAAAKYGGFWGGLAALGVEAGKFGVYAGGKTSGGFDVANQSDSYGQALHHQAPQSFTALTP